MTRRPNHDTESSQQIRKTLGSLLAGVQQVKRTRSWKSILRLRNLKHAIRKPNGIDPYAELDRAVHQAAAALQEISRNSQKRETLSSLRRRPLVSVLMPIHNHAHLAAEAVESVLAQFYLPFELIIVDDGSTDGLSQVLNPYKGDARVQIHTSGRQGLPRTLSQLHGLARGELITWTSADNRMLPEALDVLVRHLERHPHDMLAYADVRLMDETGEPLIDNDYAPAYRDPADPSVLRLPHAADALSAEPDNFVNGCFCYRRDAAEALGLRYADDLPGLEDYDFWLRLQKAGPLRHVKSTATPYLYRVHDRSLTHELAGPRKSYLESASRRLLEYDRGRQAWCRRRWTVQLAGAWPEQEAARWRMCLEQLPVNVAESEADREQSKVVELRLGGSETDAANSARLEGATWHCRAKNENTGEYLTWHVPAGVDLPAIAKKARHLRRPHPVSAAKGRPIVGVHHPLADLESYAHHMKSNPDLFFAWIGFPNDRAKDFPTLSNAGFITTAVPGEPIAHYAAWDVVLDVDSGHSEHDYALALATGKWTLIVRSDESPSLPEWGPYQTVVKSEGDWAATVSACQAHPVEADVADRQLAWRTSATRLGHILRLFDAAGQEDHLPRPNFEAPADWTHPK